MYTVIAIDEDGNKYYLNHAYMNSLAFGAEEMMWLTDDKEKAELMLYEVERESRNPDRNAYTEYDIEEV